MRAYRLYTRLGACVSLSEDRQSLIYAPVSVCDPNLLVIVSNDRVLFVDGRSELSGSPSISVGGIALSKKMIVPLFGNEQLKISSTPQKTTLIGFGSTYLRTSGNGRCLLSDASIDHTCEFYLAPCSDVIRQSDTMTLSTAGNSIDIFRPTLEFPEISECAEELVAQGHLGRALELVFHTVNANCLQPRFKGRALFIPDLDQILSRISDRLCAGVESVDADNEGRLIVASEIYVAGGHSRIIEDIAETLPRSTILLTDCFRNIETNRIDISYFRKRLPRTSIMRLGGASLLDKTMHMIRFAAQTRPSTIYFLSHHQDPIPYAALSNDRVAGRKIFVHHTDHNPSLGATYQTFEHFDCTRHLASVCSCVLRSRVKYLPLSVDDSGLSVSTASAPSLFSTVTAGNAVKFVRYGENSYSEIIIAVLKSISGHHYHIGHLDHEWILDIHDALTRNGIDRDRFVHLGVVPSLWETLKGLDAHVYVASAPTPGTRAAIEAQGAGLPTLFFQDASVEPLLRMQEMYASLDLGWSTITEIPERIARLSVAYRDYAQAAREHYEKNYSRHTFIEVISQT